MSSIHGLWLHVQDLLGKDWYKIVCFISFSCEYTCQKKKIFRQAMCLDFSFGKYDHSLHNTQLSYFSFLTQDLSDYTGYLSSEVFSSFYIYSLNYWLHRSLSCFFTLMPYIHLVNRILSSKSYTPLKFIPSTVSLNFPSYLPGKLIDFLMPTVWVRCWFPAQFIVFKFPALRDKKHGSQKKWLGVALLRRGDASKWEVLLESSASQY